MTVAVFDLARPAAAAGRASRPTGRGRKPASCSPVVDRVGDARSRAVAAAARDPVRRERRRDTGGRCARCRAQPRAAARDGRVVPRARPADADADPGRGPHWLDDGSRFLLHHLVRAPLRDRGWSARRPGRRPRRSSRPAGPARGSSSSRCRSESARVVRARGRAGACAVDRGGRDHWRHVPAAIRSSCASSSSRRVTARPRSCPSPWRRC